jgi:hypothetical protein
MQISRQPTALAPTSGIVTSSNSPPAITPSAIVALALIMVGVGQIVASSNNRRDTHASVHTPQTDRKTPILQPSEVGELWDKYGRLYTSTQIKHNPDDHSEAQADKDLINSRAWDGQSNQTTYRPMTYAKITRNHSGYSPFPGPLDQRGRLEKPWNEADRVLFQWSTFPEQMQLKLCFTWNMVECFMSHFEKEPTIKNLPENERPHAMDRAREYVFCKLYAQYTNQSARIKVGSIEDPLWLNITHQLSLAILDAQQISDTVIFCDRFDSLGRHSTCPEDCEDAIRIQRELFLNSFQKQEKKEKIGNIVSSIYFLGVSSLFFLCILPGAGSSQLKTSESISPNLATPSPPTPPLAPQNKSMIQRLLRR